MQLDSNSLIMQWNTDINGNPVSKHIAREVQQISPTHNLIQLTQIPDEFYPLRIVTEDNVELKEVKYRNDVTETTFCVDYGMGLVYFDSGLSGKMVVINYYGRGVMLISDSRIFHKNGDTIADTWDNILERSQDALDLIEHAGGLSNAIKVIDQKVEEGTKVADRIEDFITETQFYGYTITLSREAFVVKADDNGEVGKTETSSVYTDVIVYQGAKQIIPTLSITDEYGCTFKVVGQRVSLATIDVNLIKVNAVLNIDCGDGLVAKRVLEVTKVFDGVNQYQVSMTNPFYSFQANSEGYIEEDQSVECSFKVSKANIDYENYTVQIQNLPQGLNYKINKGSVVFTAITGRLLPSSGSCSVVLMIDGQSFNKPFTWNKAKKGQDAKSLTLVGNQIIRYEQPDFSDIPLQTKTTVSAKVVGLSGTPTWSFYNGVEWVVLENETAMDLTFAHNDTTIWADRKEVTIKCQMEVFHDELTIVKLANGTNGNDAITVILTNESHTVSIDDSGFVATTEIENARTNVLAYKGANSVTPKITRGNCVGCDVSIAGNTVQLLSLDNSFTSSTAELLVDVEGVIITKIWTISKSKQGLQGESGQNGKSYILNVTGGTRSVTYSQINHDPRPSHSSTFVGTLYEDGEEIVEGVSWYWIANGHFEGSSLDSNFTPTIKKVFDESVTNNSISVMATYNGQTLTQDIPLSVTKDAYGLDWVSEWDSTKVDVRGNLILTPKIFAGHYDQENDLITGVAIGQDVLNNGRTIGVVGYQNNVPSFLLDTDGSLQVGNPFDENATGLYYSDGVFKLRVSELSIEGSKVPTQNEIGSLVTSEVNSAKNEIQETINGLNNSLGSLEDVVNNSLQDGILTEVERQTLKTVMDTLTNEMNTLLTQVGSVLTNPFLSNVTLVQQLQVSLEEYQNTYNTLLEIYVRIVSTDTPSDEDSVLFNDTMLQLNEKSEALNQLLIDCLTNISQTQAQQLVDKAKEEIQAEVSDVNDALADLENTINTDFKAGLITSINAANLENQLQQLAKEKADLDSQYNVIYNNTKLSNSIKSKLLQAKSDYDIAHDTLVAKIETSIADNLMTEAELQEINRLITVYTQKLATYSGVAQESNADIALNSAQAVVEALDQEAIFNKLTNNGEVQGLYLQNGKVYINGEYVNTRNLRAVRNDGTETFRVDSEGNVSIKANSFHLVGTDTNLADKNYVDTAIGNANINLTQDKVFNALTNNGQTQGIYLENSKIYINGEYIKAKSISGDKISAGVITATNGKSTINLDNGAMNLGNTTDASYLQWTGSDLNIKAKNISIGSSSVATSSDVTSAVNTAVNNIQVGGTNLAYDTNKGTTGWGWSIQTNNGKTITGETINGINCVKFTKDSTSGSGWSYVSYGRFKRDKITPSTTYVVSFEMKSNLSFNVASVNLMNGDSSNSLVKTITTIQNKVVANSTTWNKIIFELTTTDTLSTSTAQVIYITGIPYSANATHYFRNLKLEVGNKATQWSPAPEDIDSSVQGAITTSKEYTNSQINSTKDAIELSVSNTYETKTNVSSKVSSTLTSAKQYADTKKSEAISTASSDATSKANNALSSAKSYADTKKSEAITSANNTLNNTIANYYTKAQTDSQIKIAKDAIDLSVKNTYETKANVQSQIDNIQVGSRNLVQNSTFNSTNGWAIGSGWSVNKTEKFRDNNSIYINRSGLAADGWTELLSNPVNVKQGEKIVGSWYIKYRDCDMTSIVCLWGYKADGSNRVDLTSALSLYGTNTNWTRYVLKGTVPANVDHVRLAISHRRNGIIYAAMPQLEYGNTATDWSPSPVDVSNDISQAKSDAITSANNTLNTTIANYYTKSQTDSQINVAKDAINLGVSQTYETKTNVTSKVNSAISTASSDATSKANNALSSAKSYADTKKTEAINSANNTLNTTIANYYTKNETDSRINMTKDSINLSVSNFKSEMMSASFTNLLYNSDFVKMENDFPKGYTRTNSTYVYNGDWLCPEGGKTIHIYTIGTGITWQGFYSPNVRVNKDQTMTASVYVATENKDALQGSVGVEIEWVDANYQRISVSGYSCKLDQNHLWYRITTTGSAPEGTVYARIFCWNSFEGATWWGKPMLQIGSVCTAWNKGGDFENLDERLSSAEIKITDDSITNLVKQNFYTKSETEGQITSKGYQTSSQVQQTVDQLQIKFTQKGGYNLIRNGGFENGDHNWHYNNSPTVIGDQPWQNYDGKSMLLQGHSFGSGLYQVFPTVPNKVYSYSFYAQAERDTWFVGVEGLVYSTVQVSPHDWRYYSGTFTATGTSHVFVIYPNGGDRNIYIDNIMVCEGSIPSVYTPHPSEVYDGITTIDKDGITVKGSDQAYTNFNSAGMNSFNNSGQQTLGIRNGGITFHPYSSNQLGAYITQSALHGNSAAANGLAISTANNGTYISLGTSSLSDANTTLNMDQALTVSANDNFQPKGINLWKDTHAHGYGIRQLSHLRLAGSGAIQFDYLNTSPSTIYEAVDGGHSLYVMGGYQTHIGCMDGQGTPKGVIWMQNSTNTHSYTHWNFHNYTMYNMRTATSYANTLSNRTTEVHGVNSNVDGIRYLYRDIELVDGKAVRSIPNAYKGCSYDIVSIVCKGKGNAWIENEDENKFEINGECRSVNVEVIIYPASDVMTISSVKCDEAPELTLPKNIEGEIAPMITN